MNKATEVHLNLLTMSYDDICDEIKKLEDEKAKVRAELITTFDKAIREEYPGVDDPTDMGFQYVNTVNGLVYKKTTAVVGTKFDGEKFFNETGRGELVTRKVSYTLDEKKAEKACQEEPELYPLLAKYTTPGKTQVRIYTGKAATDSDL